MKTQWIAITNYRCPICHTHSRKMKLLNIRYKPNKRELLLFPVVTGELLECQCGRIYRWNQLQEIQITTPF